jgi:hypothetical protein
MQLANGRLTNIFNGPSVALAHQHRTKIRGSIAVDLDRFHLNPCGNCLIDSWPGIFLDEVRTWYGGPSLVSPASTELPDGTDQDRTWVRVDE